MNQPDLGLKVSELRLQKNLTQEQLAEKAGVDRKTISRIENGDQGIRLRTINAVLSALGIELCAKCEQYEDYCSIVYSDE